MASPFNRLLEWMDGASERGTRIVAQTIGRRSFVASLGTALLGTALAPMLPFDRTFGAARAQPKPLTPEEVADCDYWRYCALDGYLCSECGGTITQCPPGSSASIVSWVGTCLNPGDNRHYLVGYYDCCGGGACADPAFCFHSEGERPGYRMGLYNDINWCMANETLGYHCTVAVLLGVAE